jgi:hypothetical protein
MNTIVIKLARNRFNLFLNRGDVLKYVKDDTGKIIKAYGYFNRFMNKAFWLDIAE